MPPSDADRLRVPLLALSLGALTAGFIIAKTGRDALFFQGTGGLLRLPLVYINIAGASLPLALLFVKAMKIWGARPARLGILLFAATIMAAASPFLRPGDNILMLAIFIFIPAIFGLLFASLWLLSSDIFETAEKTTAARAFSKIGAGTLAGGMVGGLASKSLAPHLNPNWLIFLAAMIIVAVVMLVRYIHRCFPSNIASNKDDAKKAGFLAPLRNNYAATLLFISMTGALAGLLIDFQFYSAAATAGMGARGNTNFFANFYISLNLSSLLLQLFATPKIQDKVGLRGGLMVLPIALIGGAGFATAAATALSLSVLRVTEGGLRSSVHRSIWEQAFIPLASAERSAVKLAIDGVAARVAEALGAFAILLWLKQVAPDGIIPANFDTRWLTGATLIVVSIWLAITRNLREQIKQDRGDAGPAGSVAVDTDCERFPDQCPCTTELGKGIA